MISQQPPASFLLKDIIKSLLEEIENIGRIYNANPAIEYDSAAAYESLIEFLNNRLNSNETVGIRSLKPFCDFLAERWFKIKKTPASYFNNPRSLASHAYFLLASRLAKHLKVSVWSLLIPTVHRLSYIDEALYDNNFHLHQIILVEDDLPVDIIKCLDDAVKRRSLLLFHTFGLQNQLNDEDTFRVINHSTASANYYEAIKLYLADGNRENLLIARDSFIAAIKSDTYEVRDSFGIEGKKRLTQNVLSRFNTFDTFIQALIMGDKLKLISFLNGIDNIKFKQIMLNGAQLSERIKCGYNGDVAHDRVLLFCFLEVYWRDRDEQDKYTTPLGWFADYTYKIAGGYNKDEKEAAVILLQVFLLSKYNLNEFKIFLNNLDLNEIQNYLKLKLDIQDVNLASEQMKQFNKLIKLIETDIKTVINAMNAGLLGLFPQQLNLLCEEENKNHFPTSKITIK